MGKSLRLWRFSCRRPARRGDTNSAQDHRHGFERREERVITEGLMVNAVAASIAIPGLISGPALDGRVHVDGGVTNPVPFRTTCVLIRTLSSRSM